MKLDNVIPSVFMLCSCAVSIAGVSPEVSAWNRYQFVNGVVRKGEDRQSYSFRLGVWLNFSRHKIPVG